MPLTQEQRDRIREALERVSRETAGADDRLRVQLTQAAIAEAAGDVPPADMVAFLVDYRAELQQRATAESRASRAKAAIAAAVAAEGVRDPGELMAKRGLKSAAGLLAWLGFTGDLEALGREIEGVIASSQ